MGWISLYDQAMPDCDQLLVYSSYRGVEVADFVDGYIGIEDVTHWMPLPKPPKDK